MSAAWVAFARTGSPNAPGLARWPAFADKESYLEFGDQIAVKEALHKVRLDLLGEYTDGLRSHAAGNAAGGGSR